MSINQINSGNFSEKDIKKSQKSRPNSIDSKPAARQSSSRETVADRFTPSGTRMTGDFDLATAELEKLRKNTFSSLKEVKMKIQDGTYDNKEVHQKIGELVKKDLRSMEQLLSKMPGSEEIDSDKKKLTPEYKKYLIENPRVVKQVADKIAQDLQHLGGNY